MKIDCLLLTFECDKKIVQRPDWVRGYFGRKFQEYILLHQHEQGGKLRYKYPLVQYHVIRGQAMIIGIKEGVEILKSIYDEVDDLLLRGRHYKIYEKNIHWKKVDFGSSKDMIHYRFIHPWLALNQKNFPVYISMKSWSEKKIFLSKILMGNVLSMAKGVEYTVTNKLKVEFKEVHGEKMTLKGTSMLGFLGSFRVNFKIPDYWGLGKSVSRGFGVVEKVAGRREFE